MISKQKRYQFRKARTRKHLQANFFTRPRLSVYRSGRYLYAQVVDDNKGQTLAAASSLDKEIKDKAGSGKSVASAKVVGSLVAKRAIGKGVKNVCFDRGARVFHGRVKAIAEAAREAGLNF